MTVRELIEKLQEFDEWNEVGSRLENVCVLDVLAETDKNGCTFFINDSEPMQSTGLIDKNGKEVFENDVIRDSDGFEGIVQYDESYGMYGIAYLPTLSNGIDMTFEELKDNFRNKFEVIGNIYENPELVEEE